MADKHCCLRSFFCRSSWDYSQLEEIIKTGVNLNKPLAREDRRYPLHIAAKRGDNAVVKLLLDNGAKVDLRDENRQTSLHMAAQEGNHETVQFLLSRGAAVSAKNKEGDTPLHKTKSVIVAEILLRNGASARDKNHLNQLALHCVHMNAPPGSLREITELLIDHGAPVDGLAKYERSPLYFAASNSNWEASSVLISKGANINRQDDNGWSILHCAIHSPKSSLANVEFLLNHGASPNVQMKDGSTPLHMAASYRAVGYLLLILGKGVKLDIQDERGCTALHEAALVGECEPVAQLLTHGFSISVKTINGETPYVFHDPGSDVHHFMATYVNKCKLAGLPVTIDVDLDMSEDEKANCLKELERVKSTAIGEGITLYNIFSEYSRPKYLLSEGVIENTEGLLHAPDFHSQFPMYADILKGTFVRSVKSRYYLTKKAVASMMSYKRHIWCQLTPDLVWEHVFRFLEVEDLTSIIQSGL